MNLKEYLIENFATESKDAICEATGLTWSQVVSRAHTLRTRGVPVPKRMVTRYGLSCSYELERIAYECSRERLCTIHRIKLVDAIMLLRKFIDDNFETETPNE